MLKNDQFGTYTENECKHLDKILQALEKNATLTKDQYQKICGRDGQFILRLIQILVQHDLVNVPNVFTISSLPAFIGRTPITNLFYANGGFHRKYFVKK